MTNRIGDLLAGCVAFENGFCGEVGVNDIAIPINQDDRIGEAVEDGFIDRRDWVGLRLRDVSPTTPGRARCVWRGKGPGRRGG